MRVLITNCAMRSRSGTEVVTLELALGLLRRGHEVAVLTALIGPTAALLRREGIVVADRTEELRFTPDIIHGHHNHVLAAALAAFPEVPALFVSHGSTHWFDGPIRLPRVRRFCAVHTASRERLASGLGCAVACIDLLLNAVDLDQYLPRPPLPIKPRRALLMAKNTEHIAAVRTATADAGLMLDAIGPAVGNVVDDLPNRLAQYDVVFATARMAIEALAVGCAVVVVDGRGLAGLATAASIDAWRRDNFGLRLLTRAPAPDAIRAELLRYDADDAARASNRIRETASLSRYLDDVEDMYRAILAEPHAAADHASDLRALGAFMAEWLRRLGEGVLPENFDMLVAANEEARIEARMVNEENVALRLELARAGVTGSSAAPRAQEFRRYWRSLSDFGRRFSGKFQA
jgi:hypothetical protein